MGVKTKKEVAETINPNKKPAQANADVKKVNRVFFDVNELANTAAQEQGAPPNTTAVMLAEIMAHQFSTENLAQKTELNEKQIIVFSQSETFADRYELPLLKKIVYGIMEKSISKNRKGRKEWESIAKASFGAARFDDEEQIRKGIPARLAGL